MQQVALIDCKHSDIAAEARGRPSHTKTSINVDSALQACCNSRVEAQTRPACCIMAIHGRRAAAAGHYHRARALDPFERRRTFSERSGARVHRLCDRAAPSLQSKRLVSAALAISRELSAIAWLSRASNRLAGERASERANVCFRGRRADAAREACARAIRAHKRRHRHTHTQGKPAAKADYSFCLLSERASELASLPNSLKHTNTRTASQTRIRTETDPCALVNNPTRRQPHCLRPVQNCKIFDSKASARR